MASRWPTCPSRPVAPAIFRQVLATGEREQLTNFRGLNSSPAWSPDGNTLAMVLSKDGSPDIYLMDLASRV
jgi:TolB protein